MAIQVLTRDEIEVVAGGDITVGGPGIAISLNPFTLLTALLNGTLGVVSGAVSGVVGLVTGLLGTVTGLLGGIL